MINIDAISSIVPQKKVDVQIFNKKFGKDYVKKISEYSGYKNLHILEKKQKSYELALKVSKNLISQFKFKNK